MNKGRPTKEPTSGHTLILGRPGSGKSTISAFLMTQARRAGARVFVFDYRLAMEMAVRANGGRYAAIEAGSATGLNPLQTETDERGQSWLSDWLAALIHRSDKPLSPAQTNIIQEVIRQNATASADLRNWSDLASLFVSADDGGDLHDRLREWTAEGRYGWIFGQNAQDTFSLEGDMVGFDLTGILDSDSEKERMAVLSYIFRRVERVIEDRKPTIIIIDEAWKALDNPYFASAPLELAGHGSEAERGRRDDDAVCLPARTDGHGPHHHRSGADANPAPEHPGERLGLRDAEPAREGTGRAAEHRQQLPSRAGARRPGFRRGQRGP